MPTADVITVACACGKRLKAPATSVGKRARCPACQGTVVVAAAASPARATTATGPSAGARPNRPAQPAPPMPRPVPVAPSPAADDGMDALYELAEQASAAVAVRERPRCPQCRTGMDEGAVLCTQCGYDTRTGKALSTATVAAPAKGNGRKQPVDMMAPQGSIVVGVAMSAAFALAASVVWVVVAMVTGYMVGYLAILIGAAAGAGMKVGQKGVGGATGIAAAGVTFGTIVVAKLVVAELYLRQHMPGVSIADVDSSRLAAFVFEPVGLVMMVIGVLAAFRAAK